MDTSKNEEIEVRFLEIKKDLLTKRLQILGATEIANELLRETIYYDRELSWKRGHRFVRVREVEREICLSLKDREDGVHTTEVKLYLESQWKDELLQILGGIGLVPYRVQEKRRQSFIFDGVEIDFDEWPGVPVYVELEGPSYAKLEEVCAILGLDWSKANRQSAGIVLEETYGIPIREMRELLF